MFSVRSVIAACVCLLFLARAGAQNVSNSDVRPAILMQRAYVDYIWVKGCGERQSHSTKFVSSEDFVSFAEMQRARGEITFIEQALRQFDPNIDFNALWKKAARNQQLRGADSFGALMMLGLKSNNERCRYYLDDLSSVADIVPTLAEADKDF
jgi:hypothetical protein